MSDRGTPATAIVAPLTFRELSTSFLHFCRRDPVALLLLLGVAATLVYFFGFFKTFTNGQFSTAHWAWLSWNPENNQEHSVAILPVSIFLLWYHRAKLAAAPKQPSNAGLLIVGAGIICFLLAVRTIQPRLAVFALPVIILGCAWFFWGRKVARILLFPCAFMLFMIPIGNYVHGTVSLQLLVSSACSFLSSLIGVKIETIGTTIRPLDGSFNFEIAEGCSGIRSLMAMITLTALYVHFTQRVLWKKVVVFCGSIVFALIGNIGRIFTVILVAKFIDPALAGGLYHDYSDYVFFPIAVLAMIGFANLLKVDVSRALISEKPPDSNDQPGHAVKPPTYDY